MPDEPQPCRPGRPGANPSHAQLAAALRTTLESYRLAVEASAIGTWEIDLATGKDRPSERTREILGVPPGCEMSLGRFMGCIHPDDRQRVERAVQAALVPQGTGEYESEFRLVHPDGTVRWAAAKGRALFAGRGAARRPVRMLGTILDISARKLAEAGLRRSEARYRRKARDLSRLAAIVESSADAIISVALDGRILTWNAGAQRLYGYSAAEALGRHISVLHPRGDPEESRGFLRQVQAGKSVGPVERERVRRDGTHVRVALTISAIRDHNGRIVGASKIEHDVTAERRARILGLERDHLRRAVKIHERVLNVVSHELRTPLAAIRAATELLLDGAVTMPEPARAVVASVHEESIHMAGMLNDLLEVARLCSGTATWDWGLVSLGDACAEVLDQARPALGGSPVELEAHVDPPDLAMRGDANAIRRLLHNLTVNACKATPAGAVRLSAALRPGEGAPVIELRVTDTGRGIAPAALERLGQAFALNSGVVGQRVETGAGLGLVICRGIAAAHGGAIFVRSAPGHGTTVTVLLRPDLTEPANDQPPEIAVERAA